MCFTSISAIGGEIYSNHPQNMNHVHIDSNDLVSVIISPVTNISIGDTLFYDGVRYTDSVKYISLPKKVKWRNNYGSI